MSIARQSFWLGLESVLLLIAIFFSWIVYANRQEQSIKNLDKGLKIALIVFGSFMVFTLIPEFFRLLQGEAYHPKISGYVERHLHLILLVPIVILGAIFKLTAIDLWKILITATVFVLWVLLSEFHYLQLSFSSIANHRFGAMSSSSVIDFGIYSNTLFVILIGTLFWFKRLSNVWKVLLLFALVISLSGAILSQSRTAWIGWPEAFIGWGSFYIYRLYKLKRIKMLIVFLMGVILVISAIAMSPAKEVLDKRIGMAMSDIAQYNNGNPSTSFGQRFVMYEIGVNQIKETPWLGIGISNFRSFLEEESQKVFEHKYGISGKISFSQIHNQFLMYFVTGGILAFTGLVLLFGFLLYYFFKKIKGSQSDDDKVLGIAGMIFTITSLMTFLPESPLQFKAQFVFFFTITFLLVVVNENSKERQAAD